MCQRHIQTMRTVRYTEITVRITAGVVKKTIAYVTSAAPQRAGANWTGSVEMSHRGVWVGPSRGEDRSMGISTIQLPSRRVSTARSIYTARSETGKATTEGCEHTANVVGTFDATLPTKTIVASFSHLRQPWTVLAISNGKLPRSTR